MKTPSEKCSKEELLTQLDDFLREELKRMPDEMKRLKELEELINKFEKFC